VCVCVCVYVCVCVCMSAAMSADVVEQRHGVHSVIRQCMNGGEGLHWWRGHM